MTYHNGAVLTGSSCLIPAVPRYRVFMSLSRTHVSFGAAVLLAACGGSSNANLPDGGPAAPDGVPVAGTSGRDWSKNPAIAHLDCSGELWVLSDVHGDYQAFTKLLAGAHLVAGIPDAPEHLQWMAGSATLVVVGDLIDKGPDAVDVVRAAMALQGAAQAAGGHVIVTMGNHEAEFLANPENDKASGDQGVDPELQKQGLTPQATASGQNDVGRFLRGLPFAARVDDWFFVHAGKTNGRTLAALSADLRAGIDAQGYGAPVLSADDSLLEARLAKTGAQWWDSTGDARGLRTKWTTALGAKHLVMGHQPGAVSFADGKNRAADEMFEKYDGLLFLVDTGLSVGVDGTGGRWLHVKGAESSAATWEAVLPDGSTQPIATK